MLRLSKLADYAVLTLVELGRHEDVVTSSAIATGTGVPEPTVAKVLKTLAANGLVVSQRGARGGYRLAMPQRDISIARVIAAVDGPIALTACVNGGAGCDNGADCALYGSWEVVNEAIRAALAGISIARMAEMSAAARRPCVGPALPDETAMREKKTATETVGALGG